jgi:hypothetical protein
MKGTSSTLVDNYGKRRVILTLLLGLVVTGTALLVQAQVEGVEYGVGAQRGRLVGARRAHGRSTPACEAAPRSLR